jgi:hypothetical protein
MAIGPVLTVLSNLPWGAIVESAPKVAENASRLWESVKKRRSAPTATDRVDPATASSDRAPPDLAQLQSRVSELQSVITGLEDELRSSTVVIKDLADQNALLIERVERARRALRRVVIAGTVWLALLSTAMLSIWTGH